MATLRDLLYVGDNNRHTYDVNTDATVFTNNYNLQPQGCTFIFQRWCGYTPDNAYNSGCMCNWCIPSGTLCCVTFEIWGGGGGGAGACCCMQGTPGGSGAYAKKTIVGTSLAGCKYQLCVGLTTDCAINCCGILGCPTYITGYGLSNFCAEGGYGGRNCCFTHWGNYFCAGNNNGYVVNFGFSCTDCRCYYGADCGAPGRQGFMWSQCSCNSCWWKYILPYPGGLVNEGGGYTTIRVQGHACINEWMKCVPSIGYSTDPNGNFMPGLGGISATSCGGGCCYGFAGTGGMIRITYR